MSPTHIRVGTRAGAWPRGLVAAAAGLLVAVFLLPVFLHTPLVDPDEGLHAAIAREMVERGDWVTPRLLGEPFLDKPALYFWALAACVKAFGPNELAIRLPGLFFGALGALAAGLLARRVFGRTAGVLAGVFQASALLPLALTEVAVHDIALVPWTTFAVLAFHAASQAATTRGTLGWGAVAGVWIGLALLTKALTGVALVGLPVALWCVGQRQLRPALLGAGVLGLLVGAAIAAPWYAAMEAANPGYLHYYFVERHLLGYATTSQLHGQRPWWYYLPFLAAGSLPWLPYAHRPLRVLALAWKHGQPTTETRGVWLLVTWVAADTAFLSFAGSKLVTYVLPVFPAVVGLAAHGWADALEAAGTPTAGWRASHVIACASMAALGPVCAWTAAAWLTPDAGGAVSIGFSLALLVAMAAWGLAWVAALLVSRRAGPHALTAVTAAHALTVAIALAVCLPVAALPFTARELARHYNAEGRLPARMWFYDERVGSFLYYLDAPLRAGLTPDRVTHGRPEVLLSLRQAPADTVVVIPVEQLPRLERRIPLARRPFVQAGHHRAYDAGDFVAALREAVDGR